MTTEVWSFINGSFKLFRFEEDLKEVWNCIKTGIWNTFLQFFPSLCCISHKFFHSEGRQDWSHPLGGSNSLWEVHQVHLQAKLHHLSEKQEKKMHLNSCNCTLKVPLVPSHLRMETFWSEEIQKLLKFLRILHPPVWFFPLLLHSSWNSVCFSWIRWETTAWNVLRIKGKAEKNTGDRAIAT